MNGRYLNLTGSLLSFVLPRSVGASVARLDNDPKVAPRSTAATRRRNLWRDRWSRRGSLDQLFSPVTDGEGLLSLRRCSRALDGRSGTMTSRLKPWVTCGRLVELGDAGGGLGTSGW